MSTHREYSNSIRKCRPYLPKMLFNRFFEFIMIVCDFVTFGIEVIHVGVLTVVDHLKEILLYLTHRLLDTNPK